MEYTPVELESMISRIDERVQNGIMDGQIESVVADIGSDLVSNWKNIIIIRFYEFDLF